MKELGVITITKRMGRRKRSLKMRRVSPRGEYKRRRNNWRKEEEGLM